MRLKRTLCCKLLLSLLMLLTPLILVWQKPILAGGELGAPQACDGHTLELVNGCPACVKVYENGTYVHICNNNFPNEDFQIELRGQFNIPGMKYVYIDLEDIKSKTKLCPAEGALTMVYSEFSLRYDYAEYGKYCGDQYGWNSLRGIEFFENLEELDCSNGFLEELDLSKNKKLKKLDCAGNRLIYLDLSANTELEEVDCSYNQLKSLSFTKNKKLLSINVGNNPLESLDILNNKILERLDVSNTFLKSLNSIKMDYTHILKEIRYGEWKWRLIEVREAQYRRGSTEPIITFTKYQYEDHSDRLVLEREDNNKTDTQYTYDEKGNVTMVVTEGPNHVSVQEYRYDEKNRKVAEYYNNKLLYEWEYAESDDWVKEYSYASMFIMTTERIRHDKTDGYSFEYKRSYSQEPLSELMGDGGNPITWEDYDSANRLIRRDCSSISFKYEYDSLGNIVSQYEGWVSTFNETDNRHNYNYYAVNHYIYDSEGRLLEIKTQYSDGTGDSYPEYSYDKHGNLAKKKISLSPYHYISYVYEYYSTSVTHVIKNDNNDKRNFSFKTNEEFEDLILSLPSTEYNPRLAHCLAYMSRAAYDQELVKENYQELGFVNIKQENYDDGPLAAFTIGSRKTRDGNQIVLVTIRGSSTLAEWLQSDFNIGNSAMLLSVGFHSGFFANAEEVCRHLKDFMGDEISSDRVTYVITGHSLGAATGNVLSLMLDNDGITKDNVYNYNFACPNVAIGSPDMSVWNHNGEHNNIINVGNWCDFVSHLPGIGLEKLSIGNSEFNFHKEWSKWKRFGASYWFDNGFHLAVQAHDMETYIDYLEKELDATHFRDKEFVVQSVSALCPVDLVIYDIQGDPIVGTVNDKPNYYGFEERENAFVFTAGDRKMFYILDTKPIRVRLYARDDGVMDFYIQTIDLTSGTVVSQKRFESVELQKDDCFRCEFGGDTNASFAKLLKIDEDDKVVAEVLSDGTKKSLEELSFDDTLYGKEETVSFVQNDSETIIVDSDVEAPGSYYSSTKSLPYIVGAGGLVIVIVGLVLFAKTKHRR